MGWRRRQVWWSLWRSKARSGFSSSRTWSSTTGWAGARNAKKMDLVFLPFFLLTVETAPGVGPASKPGAENETDPTDGAGRLQHVTLKNNISRLMSWLLMTEDPESSWWLAKLLGSFLRKGKLNSCTNSGGMLITVHHQAGQGRSESCSSWSQKEGGQGLFSNFFDISFISTRYHIYHENRCWTQRLLSRGWRVLLPLGSVSAFLQPLFRIITYSKQLSPGSKHDRWEPIWEPLRLQQDNSWGDSSPITISFLFHILIWID